MDDGSLFTCLACSATDIKMTRSMETDFFIIAFRRFVAKCGKLNSVRGDNRSNSIETEMDLGKCIAEQNHHQKTGRYLLVKITN